MTGTFVNAIAVRASGLLGLLLGRRFPERMRETMMTGIGLATLLIGLQMALQTGNILGIIVSLSVGAVIGEGLHLEEGLEALQTAGRNGVPARSRAARFRRPSSPAACCSA